MAGNPYIIADGEVQVTQKVTWEVIHVVGGQPIAVAEFRNREEAIAYTQVLAANGETFRSETR